MGAKNPKGSYKLLTQKNDHEIPVHEIPQEPRPEQMRLPLNPNAGTFIPEVKVEEPPTNPKSPVTNMCVEF